MIKKILYTSLIVFEVMLLCGCDEGTTDPISATVHTEETTMHTGDEGDTEQTTVTEEASSANTENSSPATKDYFEQFEEYKIKKIYETMKANTKVNVRKGPASTYEKVNVIEKGKVVNVIGQCSETGWYMIDLDGESCFVSDDYLVVDDGNANLVLGDECPYKLYVKQEYKGQIGWFYRKDLGWQPSQYEKILQAIAGEGYTKEHFPVYIGTWRDTGAVMWLGYSK